MAKKSKTKKKAKAAKSKAKARRKPAAGRKVAVKKKKAVKARRKAKSKTIGGRIADAYKAVVDTVKGTDTMRNKMEQPGTSESE